MARSYTTGFWALFVNDTVAEESRFVMADGKVIPKSYHYTKKKKGKLREERVEFDSEKGVIVSSFTGGTQRFSLSGNESDKLIYQLMIREALKRGKRELNYSVVDWRELRSYQFRVGGLEVLDTDIGSIEAVRVDRTNEEKRKTTIWFAPSLNYLPIKIVQDADDHNFSSTIISTSLRR